MRGELELGPFRDRQPTSQQLQAVESQRLQVQKTGTASGISTNEMTIDSTGIKCPYLQKNFMGELPLLVSAWNTHIYF